MSASHRTANSPLAVMLGTALLATLALALIVTLINLWPVVESQLASPARAHPASTVRLLFGLMTAHVGGGGALLLLVVILGALGSLVHVATSFADFVGNRDFYLSWSPWYLLRPLIGASLALLLYFAVRAGFLSAGAQNTSVNPYGTAALAGLAGLFSKQATDKLREVFETLFKVSSKAGDAERMDSLVSAAPVPVLAAIDPDHLAVNATEVTLTLNGAHFIEGATVARVNGDPQDTRVMTDRELQLRVADELLSEPGTLMITAYTPPPGGGESQPRAVLIE